MAAAASSQSEPATQPFSSTSAPGDTGRTESDVVTQLQTCLQQLTLQFYASINYIATRHPLLAPVDPVASRHISGSSTNAASSANGNGSTSNAATASSAVVSGPARPPHPDPAVNPVTGQAPEGEGERDKAPLDPLHMPEPADRFQASLRELAQDLVTKTRQIEELAGRLPSLELEEEEEGNEVNEQAERRPKIGAEERRQNERIKELTDELTRLSGRVKDARERRERAKRRIESVVEVWATSQRVD